MTDLNRNKILYIDDEEDNLLVFKSTFRNHYQVITATSGPAGLDVLSEHPDIKLVITDQRMPSMTGVQFLEKLIPKHPDPTRIVLTGYSDINDIVNAVNVGKIYHYVSKPWNKDSLKLIIDKGLEHYALRRRNEELVSTLQEKNQKLLDAIDELELFLYRSSHDLRGPVASISGLIHLLKVEREVATKDSYAAKIEQQVAKLEKTLQKLSKINLTNLSEANQEEVLIDALIKEIIEFNQATILTKNIVVEMPRTDGTRIHTNPELLKIIMESVIENAILFTRSGSDHPRISIHWNTPSSTIELTVKDNGIGMNEEIQQRIFDPFFRGVDIATGNGLGLYMTRKAISKLNGKIKVISTPGQGTTFSIEIPITAGSTSTLQA